MEEETQTGTNSPGLSPQAVYDEEYYRTHCSHGTAPPYQHGEPVWEEFFERVTDSIVRSLQPRTAFDAGCAIGFLVEAFWDRGVEARGRDISEFAISQVRPDVRKYCEVGSLSDPIEGSFDLVTCVEVVEHMPQAAAELAIKQLAAATNVILFSSTPNDFDEPTHVNVRPTLYWLQQFAANGFAPDVTYDASYLAPHAMLLRRANGAVSGELLAAQAELVRLRMAIRTGSDQLSEMNQSLAQTTQKLSEATASHQRQRAREADLEGRRKALLREKEAAEAELGELRAEAGDLRGRLEAAHSHMAALDRHIASIQDSVFWRMTSPLRALADSLPTPLRRSLKKALRAIWRLVTLQILARPQSGAVAIPEAPKAGDAAADVADASVLMSAKRFESMEPLRVFRVEDAVPTVNVVTDSLGAGSLFGGVATSLILGSRLAARIGGRLRVVTRTEPADAAVAVKVLRASGVPADLEIETLYAPPLTYRGVPVSSRDYFVPTSWWTALPTVTAVGPDRVVYLLQEDERLFYPMGDEYIRCSELLNDTRIRVALNSHLLYRHLTEGPNPLTGLDHRSVVFEPAFPETLFYEDPDARSHSSKRTFLFYGRPHNARNLFWRGIEVLERSILDGILDPAEWRFVLLGKDLDRVSLPGQPEIVVGENLTLDEYARYVRAAHVGLSLIFSPHPSYPPLDLAASGAVVVTNSFGQTKVDLSAYSRNILCVGTGASELVEAVRQAVSLASDEATRRANVASSGIGRDWILSLDPVVDRIVDWCDRPVGRH